MEQKIIRFSNRVMLISIPYILFTLFIHTVIAQFDIGKTPFYTWGTIFYLLLFAYIFSFIFLISGFFVRHNYIWARKILKIIASFLLLAWPIGAILGRYLLKNLEDDRKIAS